MSDSTSSPAHAFRPAARIHPLWLSGDRSRAIEIAILISAGIVAAAAVAFLPLQIRVPGHAILKAALPMVFGISLAPRRAAGTISGIAAAAAVGLFQLAGVGNLQAAAVTSLLALGPAIDLAMLGVARGWLIYLRIAAAGLAANLLAFAVRWGTAWLELDGPRPHTMQQIGIGAFLSFAACGLAAGLLSAVICFRRSSRSSEVDT